MKKGRPSKLTPELMDKAADYINKYQEHSVIPSVAGLALYLKISRAAVYVWAKDNEDFMDILEDILSKQEQLCLSNGLTGDYNATIVKLVLGKHGYSDKQETELSGNPDRPLSVPVVFVAARD
jgi:hypothetical protein